MRIYNDIKRIGMEDTIYTLQRALTFVYNDELLEPKVTYDFGGFSIIYKYGDINIGIELPLIKLELLNLTLEQLALDIKKQVISQYRYEIDKQYGGVYD
jgi:hypothetical protein|nr:MAG TPA: hypothetical protein [Caudoviricetes sp.]DAJ18421.1 MAG TPA: hypothetical protein [Podoviridae sp. ctVfK3]